jgi:hypothetical protein
MKLLSSYFFWSYERGSIQYDVMVTAILLFVFVGPRFIDFKDRPVANVPLRSSEVLVKSHSLDGDTFTYEVRSDDLDGANTDAARRKALMDIIEPIAGEVTLDGYQPVLDSKGNTVAYQATVRR